MCCDNDPFTFFIESYPLCLFKKKNTKIMAKYSSAKQTKTYRMILINSPKKNHEAIVQVCWYHDVKHIPGQLFCLYKLWPKHMRILISYLCQSWYLLHYFSSKSNFRLYLEIHKHTSI